MLSYIPGGYTKWFNLYGGKFGNIYENYKRKYPFAGIYLILYLPVPPLC